MSRIYRYGRINHGLAANVPDRTFGDCVPLTLGSIRPPHLRANPVYDVLKQLAGGLLMKRDMDMIRDLLLRIEDGEKTFETTYQEAAVAMGRDPAGHLTRVEAEKLEGHLKLLIQAGFITDVKIAGGTHFRIGGITWKGYEFLDTLRDPDRWEKAKGAATKVGGVGLKAMVEIGKAMAKGELQKLGIPIG